MFPRQATHIHDELQARSLVLDNGERRIAIVECDAIALGRQPIVRAKHLIRKHTGISHVLIAATHTHETVRMADWPDSIEAPMQAIRLGDVGIVAFPGEAFVELGMEVKRESPFPVTFAVDLGNDYLGYIPTVAAHAQGGYETWRARSSFLECDAAPVLVSAALELLKESL